MFFMSYQEEVDELNFNTITIIQCRIQIDLLEHKWTYFYNDNK